MTLQDIQRKINEIKAQYSAIKSRVQQLAQSRGKSIINPPTSTKSTTPIVSTSSSSATKYSVPKRNVAPQLNVGTSIVDYLKSIGKPSSFEYRSQLAKQYNIPNYRGTAEQNIKLLNILKNLGAKTTTKTSTGGTTTGGTKKGGTTKGGTTIGKTTIGEITREEAEEKSLTPLTEGGKNVKDVVQDYINKYLGKIDYSALADEAKRIAEATYQPIENKLKDIINNIKAAYKSAQEDLLENQKREIEELKGAYAVRGLLNSGVYQKALQDLRKKHVQEMNDLTQREAQDITNISYEVASKKPTAINDILRVLTSELQSQRTRASILLGSLLTSELAEEREKRKEKQVATSTTVTDEKGNQYLVLLDANGNEIKRIYIGKAEKSGTSPVYGNYRDRLEEEIKNLYAGMYGTEGAREKVIRILKREFPDMDVAGDVYARVPDDWEKRTKEGEGVAVFKDTNTGKIYDLGTVAGLKEFKADHPEYTYEDMDAWMDANVKGLDAATRRNLLEKAGFKKKEFLSEEFFRNLYTEDQLKEAAKEAGFGGWFRVSSEDIDNFLKDLMNKVQQYRKAGYSDTEILKMMTK